MKKVALVTGGSRGIGAAIARGLLEDDYRVVVTGRQEPETFYQCKEEIIGAGDLEIIYMQGDIGCDSDRKAVVSQCVHKWGGIDVLVNNAGIAPCVRADILEVTVEDWEKVIHTNLTGTMFLTQEVAKQMVRQNKDGNYNGIIINIGSVSAWASSTNRAAYCASKAGIAMLTQMYADRLAGEGIFVYEIRPGVISTSMTCTVKDKYDKLIENGAFPIGRWGTPKDVAEVVRVLCQGKLYYSTGEIINVDGGFHIRRL